MIVAGDVEGRKSRVDLTVDRIGFILFYGGVLYPLFVFLDWRERPWDRVGSLVIRLAVTVLLLLLAQIIRTGWGRSKALFLASVGFLVADAGFAILVWHAKGFGSSNGDAFELFYGPYCVLIPTTTGWAALVGIAMICLQLVSYPLSGQQIPYETVAWNAVPFFLIFLTGRHVANLVEVAWRREFVKRTSLEDAIERFSATQEKLIQSEKMAALGRLTAGVAHELNNPLFVIGTNVSVLRDAVDELVDETETRPPAIQKLQDGIQRLGSALTRASVVTELLRQFSSPPSRKSAPTDINSVIEMSISLVTITSRGRGVNIHKDLSDLPSFDCDAQSLSQVFVNLLENACDAVGENGNAWVSTKVRQGGSIEISVSDDGIGISAEHLHRVKEPFFTTKEPGKGTGLGLAVATSIVEKYGGTLEFCDRNPGTKATVTFPSRSRASSADQTNS